jgi:Holliday junction resolvase-like predicted endonuclease
MFYLMARRRRSLLDLSQTDITILATITDGSLLGSLLNATKGQSTISITQLPKRVQNHKWLDSMKTAGVLQPLSNQQWLFSGTSKVQVAMQAIQLGQPERHILESLTWQEFEEFVSTIFSRHNYTVHHRYRFTTSRRYEIDVIAIRKPVLLCVDCKHYGIRRGKSSTLRKASEAQLERANALANHFAANQVKLNCLGWSKVMLLPMLVTMLHEELFFHEKIPIVPAIKLNAFILNYDKALEKLQIVHPSATRQHTLEEA